MNISLTQNALEAVRKLLAADDRNRAIYVYLAGIGCGGGGKANFSLMPVKRTDGERTVEVEGIPFEYDRLILFHTDRLEIDYPYADRGPDVMLELFVIRDAKRDEIKEGPEGGH